MLVLAKAMLAVMIGFISSVICGLIIIPFLRKIKVKQKVSVFLEKAHKKKDGTPTMGGLIFIVPTMFTVLLLLATNKLEMTYNLGITIFVFIAYAILGFIDDYLIIKRHSNEGLTEIQKLLGQVVIAIVFFILYIKGGNPTSIDITVLNISINLKWAYSFFILFLLVASSNAVNITDGLDGLAGGLSAIAFLAFGLMAWASTYVAGNQDIAVFCFILLGSLLGFLVFNTYPARVFMGDTGSLSLGGTLASIAILTNHEITFIVVAGIFIIETLSSLLQMISVRFFNKKILLMAPLHHHFEKMGYHERDIVKAYWVIGLILAMAGILYSVWI